MMRKNHFLPGLLCFATIGILSAQTSEIANSWLSIRYDALQHKLQLKEKASGKVFVQAGSLEGAATKTQTRKLQHPLFGAGEEIVINKSDGGFYTIDTYAGLPFAVIQETVLNSCKTPRYLQAQRSLSFVLDLQQPVSKLKTLGTGGLLPVDKNPGSYVFLTTVDPESRNGVVAGWLTHDRGSGVFFSDTLSGKVQLTGQIDYGRLLIGPGQKVPLEKMLVGYFDDARLGEEAFADALAKQYQIQLPERQAVYCTWYSEKNGGAGSNVSTRELVDFIAGHLKDYGLGTVQIDDQWQDGAIFNGPARGFDRAKPNGPYPNGMQEPAQKISAAGLRAGIWWMPFARNHRAPEFAARQQWFAQRLNGQPFETKWGGTSLDLTNPEVRKHLQAVATTMKKWGFGYFKMDGLWTGTVTELMYINDGYKYDSMGNSRPLFDSTKTQIEAYRSGLSLLRNSVGRDVFFSGCCQSQNMRSFGASIGLVDAMRVGPDFNHDKQSIRTGAIRASRLYFLNGRVWWNDPDPSIIRENGSSTSDESIKGIGSLTRARLLPSWVAVTGQFFLSSDWLPDLPAERLEIMKRCMLSHKGIARPVDAFDKNLPSIWLATDNHSGVNRQVLGLFNWDSTALELGSTISRTGLQPGDYYAFDFWGKRVLPDIREKFGFELPAESCQVIALRKKEDHPVLVSTSAHVTQGIVDVKKENWKNNELSGESAVVANDPYELRIAGLLDGGKWQLAGMDVEGDSKEITIEKLGASENGWTKVVIRSNTTGSVQWHLRFKKG